MAEIKAGDYQLDPMIVEVLRNFRTKKHRDSVIDVFIIPSIDRGERIEDILLVLYMLLRGGAFIDELVDPGNGFTPGSFEPVRKYLLDLHIAIATDLLQDNGPRKYPKGLNKGSA